MKHMYQKTVFGHLKTAFYVLTGKKFLSKSLCLILQALCSSRKYPYPHHGENFA